MASGTMRVDSSSGPAENGRTDEPASSARRPLRVGDYLGKHRLSAAIGRLHQEIQSLESELEELDKMEPSSAACNDVLSSMEGIPDALLPITKGPEHSAWERWFQPVRSSRNRKWWSNRESNVS
ncbi:guanine nucleotide-binding protein subunit gamma 2 isoform X2 [Dendrobium catenatum]|uniref:guanine nucleotide-binding protein subunit gamma 2 isoform X2 n=1 Tax=Dendrobium catenatum TaxID=906689 RepID=UPI0009F2518B|nr:guanine nucleotide-binding protein subunit gamma 2 isoform X2 [Dendrobium catenatum]